MSVALEREKFFENPIAEGLACVIAEVLHGASPEEALERCGVRLPPGTTLRFRVDFKQKVRSFDVPPTYTLVIKAKIGPESQRKGYKW